MPRKSIRDNRNKAEVKPAPKQKPVPVKKAPAKVKPMKIEKS